MANDPKQMLSDLMRLMGFEGKVDQFTTEDGLLLHIECADGGRLIGKQGQTLSHLQFLLNRMLRKQDPEAPHIIVDVCRYRERAHDLLIKHAQEEADRVRRWGDPVQMEPMSPYERRVLHRFYATDPEIEILSEAGDEAGRKRMTLQLRKK